MIDAFSFVACTSLRAGYQVVQCSTTLSMGHFETQEVRGTFMYYGLHYYSMKAGGKRSMLPMYFGSGAATESFKRI